MTVRRAESEEDWRDAGRMVRLYADSLTFPLDFQDLEAELADLETMYGPPRGVLLLARGPDGEPVGCAAVRPLEGDIAELKRMFVVESCRGEGLGRRLAEDALHAARVIGYARVRLDTVPDMRAAGALYASLGFREIPPYCPNPVPGATFMERELDP